MKKKFESARPALSALLCAALCASLSVVPFASCAKKEARAALLVYNEKDPFIQAFASQIIAKASGRFTIDRFDAGNSQLIQNEQIEYMLSEKADLMMVNPVDRLGAYAIIRKLQAKKVPVIFFNREPLAEDLALWDKTYYVGARAEQSGQMQARVVMDLFGGDPSRLNEYDKNADGVIQTIILKGEQGHQDAETRTSEVLHSFETNGFAIEVLALEVANWNRDEAYAKMGRLLANHQRRIELVLSNNDDMALGAISRMRQSDLFKDTNGNGRIDRSDKTWIPVVGIDGLAEAEESIAAGYLYGTVKNDSLGMAAAMVELADVLLGRAPLSSLTFPLEEGKYVWIDYQPFISQK
jgi:methyl-galactoside transport system substrate-binding protein